MFLGSIKRDQWYEMRLTLQVPTPQNGQTQAIRPKIADESKLPNFQSFSGVFGLYKMGILARNALRTGFHYR